MLAFEILLNTVFVLNCSIMVCGLSNEVKLNKFQTLAALRHDFNDTSVQYNFLYECLLTCVQTIGCTGISHNGEGICHMSTTGYNLVSDDLWTFYTRNLDQGTF